PRSLVIRSHTEYNSATFLIASSYHVACFINFSRQNFFYFHPSFSPGPSNTKLARRKRRSSRKAAARQRRHLKSASVFLGGWRVFLVTVESKASWPHPTSSSPSCSNT